MFHSFFFIRQLSSALATQLQGWEIVECFSQNKDELILGLASKNQEFFIKCNFSPQVSLIDFPQDFKRAKKNSVNLFPEILGSHVKEICQVPFDRSFYFRLDNDLKLLFKLYGRRSNILLIGEHSVSEIFRNSLAKDLDVNLEELGRSINLENPKQEDTDQLRLLLGKELAAKYPEDTQVHDLAKSLLTSQRFYLSSSASGKPELSLQKPETSLFETTDPITLCQELYHRHIRDYLFLERKQTIASQLRKKIKKLEKTIESYQLHLEKLTTRRSYEELANIVMANLHQFKPGTEELKLEDFYQGDWITIKLKNGIKPQHYAENLYRKAKNEKIEHRKTQESLEAREQDLTVAYELDGELQRLNNFRELNAFIKNNEFGTHQAKNETILPYRELKYQGFSILIGKNARSNDELTLKHARKDDLWLHARDVSGSHVVVRNPAKKKIPGPVLEGAASLAAYHSKRKNDTLCPVIYTPKKYVRKRKGDPPGAVVVDREQVIMVKPSPTL